MIYYLGSITVLIIITTSMIVSIGKHMFPMSKKIQNKTYVPNGISVYVFVNVYGFWVQNVLNDV